MEDKIVNELSKIVSKLEQPEHYAHIPGGVVFDLRRIITEILKQRESATYGTQSLTLLDLMSHYENEYNELCQCEIRDSDEVAKMVLSNEIVETISHLMRQIRDYRKL